VRELRLVRFELERYMNGYASKVANAEVAKMHAAFDCRVKNIDSNTTMDKECQRIFEMNKRTADAKVDSYLEQKASQSVSHLENQPVETTDTPLFNPEISQTPESNNQLPTSSQVESQMKQATPQQQSGFQPVFVPLDEQKEITKEPAINVPSAEVKPAEVKPAEVKPAEVKPAEVKPAEVKPVEVKPVEVKPVEVKPAEMKPAEMKPAEMKPELKQPEKNTLEKHSLPAPMKQKMEKENEGFNPLDYVHPSIRKKALEEQNATTPKVPAPIDNKSVPVNKLPTPVPVPEVMPQEPENKLPDNQEYGIKPTSPFKISRNKWGVTHKNFTLDAGQKMISSVYSQYDMIKTASIKQNISHKPKEITLYFTHGTDLTTESSHLLSQLSSQIKSNNKIQLKLFGHADKGSNDNTDKHMSQNRIHYVLKQLNINHQNIDTIAYGNQSPITGISSSDNRNRRVVIQIN
jgi:outer membrane protein OmpA-like peptidoglycan-associated protein